MILAPEGSDKKYKHGCLKAENEREDAERKAPEYGLNRAIEWLNIERFHQMQLALHNGFFQSVSDEDWESLPGLDGEVFDAIMANAMEWIIAEGKGVSGGSDEIKIPDPVLGRGGPVLSVEHRSWLESLIATPMSVYEVLEVEEGQVFFKRLDSSRP